jgi:sodium/potassium-transporting ATPase subunit alpha
MSKTHEPVATSDIELAPVERELTAEEKFKITEHTLEQDALEAMMSTNVKTGLSTEEAAIRLERDGPNALTPPPRTPLWYKLLIHLVGGFSALLWVGSILCFIVFAIDASVENLILAIVLAVVVTLTGIFAFYQELKQEKVLNSFLKLAPSTCQCLRGGEWINLNAADCVKGDIVKIEGGRKIAADVVVIEAQGVKVNNSSLTGEAEPQKRSPGCSDAENAMRSRNVAFFGTDCESGIGMGVVVRIGDETAIGCIAQGTILQEKPATLMTQEIEHFIHIIAIIAVIIGVIFFFVYCIKNGFENFLDGLILMIGLIVANVPEGLLATITVAQTITALHMAEKNVLVKDVEMVETLGSINVIASDKTGTLTQNRMTVRHAIYDTKNVKPVAHGRENSTVDATRSETTEKPVYGAEVDGFQTGIHPANKATGRLVKTPGDFEKLAPAVQGLVLAAGLCNHATFIERDVPILKRSTNGDASESALLKFAHSHTDVDVLRTKTPELACVPFNSAHKWMATIHKNTSGKGYKLYVKGAPERVLEKCATWGSGSKITPAVAQEIKEANEEVADNGERVLAFAEATLDLPDNFKFDTDDINALNFKVDKLNFLGLLSLEDPPRPEVPGAVALCHEAGIRVIMVTGDHPLTARSIAGQVGILRDGINAPIYDLANANRMDETKNSCVVEGKFVDQFSMADWKYVLSREDVVFARTLPYQKQIIVGKIQELTNSVVAVTGDGVNDAPALKIANVGIAMGTGSEVAKDAADMILMDDNFASIVNGIEEGRLIFANLKKSIAYTLTSNIPEILPFLCQAALDMPLALEVIMILCIDLGTDMAPAIAFAYEKAESDIMKQPPRDREKDKLVTLSLISFSYLQIGAIQGFGAYTAFFESFKLDDFDADLIIGQEHDWSENEGKGLCYFKNNNGDCVQFDERKDILARAQTAFLATIVVCQIGCGIACKTRLNSIFSQGMKNMVQNYAILQEIVLIAMLVYIPGLQSGFGTLNFDFPLWFIGAPFAFFIVVYDEWRKYMIRTLGKDHWFTTYFYF